MNKNNRRQTKEEKRLELKGKLEQIYQNRRKKDKKDENYTEQILNRQKEVDDFIPKGKNSRQTRNKGVGKKNVPGQNGQDSKYENSNNKQGDSANTSSSSQKIHVDVSKSNPYYKQRAKYLVEAQARREAAAAAREAREAHSKEIHRRRAKATKLTYRRTRSGQRDMSALIERAMQRAERTNDGKE